ncbi:MAG: PEP-CTERM sorting domain-containing protein, partial [Rhodobacterales bacterium]|nr:PEP-CTERM sorting domain-containing protein [Rhodobacterales bacterium]
AHLAIGAFTALAAPSAADVAALRTQIEGRLQTYRNDTGTLLAGQGSQIDGYGQAAQGQVSSFLGQLQGGADTALIQADTAGQAFRDGIVNAADSGSWVLPMDPAGTPGPAQGLINSFGSLNPFDYANRLGPSDAMDDVSRRVTEAAEALSRDSTGGADALNVRSTLASANTLLTDRSGTAITTAESRIGDAFGRYSAGLLDSTGLAGELQGQVAGMAATQTVDFDTYRSTVAQAAETFRRDGVSALANAVQGTMTGLADSLDQGAAQYRSDTGVLTGDYETAAQFEIDLVDDAVQAGIEAVKEAGENGEPFEFSELTTDGPGVHLYFDPPVAAGYDFEVASGPSFASVALPDVGDGLFDLYLWDAVAGDYAFEATLEDGVTFTFDPGGVEMFRVLGIEPDAELAPGDPFAFVTALTFVSALNGASIIQTPIVVQYDPTPPNAAPAPGTLALLGLGLVGLAWARRGKGRQAPK